MLENEQGGREGSKLGNLERTYFLNVPKLQIFFQKQVFLFSGWKEKKTWKLALTQTDVHLHKKTPLISSRLGLVCFDIFFFFFFFLKIKKKKKKKILQKKKENIRVLLCKASSHARSRLSSLYNL